MGFSYHYKNKREAGILKNALVQGKLNHAYLLVGRETAEKKNIIDEVVRGLFSKVSEDHISFYENGSHPDYLEISPLEASIKVDEVQHITEFLSGSPSYADKRIVVINEADKMNSYAMNKILKLIEEPPSYALFFLLTEVPELLLDTLKSRLTKLEFTMLANETREEGTELELARSLLEQVKQRDLEALYETLSALNGKESDKTRVLDAFEIAVLENQEAAKDVEELKKCSLMADLISNYRYRLFTNQKGELLVTSLVSEFLELYK